MIWTCQEVTDKLGDKAQITTRGIVVLTEKIADDGVPRPYHLLVAEFRGDTFSVTPEGLDYLEPQGEAPAPKASKPKGLKKPKAEVVEDSNELVDDLDLD